MAHRVSFHPLAEADFFALYGYIEARSGHSVASGYLARIEALGASLSLLPHRGVDRADLGPQIRTIAMERRVQVVYRVDFNTVEILRILYAGRDFDPDELPH